MNEQTKNQKGSPSRDTFKRMHKELSKTFWACDLDFVLVDKLPVPDIVAVLDYKQSDDDITFSEVIAYNALMGRGLPVYVVVGDAEAGSFIIYHYRGGNHRKPRVDMQEVRRTENWQQFAEWEQSVRQRRFNRLKE
jgi:hypothetical protein